MTEQLKALADAAPKGEWTVVSHNWEFSSVYAGTGVIARCQAPFSMTDDDDDGESLEKAKDDIAAYIAAANPERILALIAENERLANSRKSVAPVAYRWVWKSKYPDIEGWCYQSTPPAYPERQEIENLYTHPPEADKLLQQALEALEYRLQQTRPIHQADSVMEAIRTYLENKNA